jgi:hypothetical protein
MRLGAFYTVPTKVREWKDDAGGEEIIAGGI